MDLIRLKNVEKKYRNGVTAIYDLNLAIEKGSFVFVIGGSGSGKSTLIKMLYREEKMILYQGDIRRQEQKATGMGADNYWTKNYHKKGTDNIQ